MQQLLTESAGRFAGKPAVVARGRTLTYAELELLSNQVARRLRERGLRKGDRIGIYFPKAVESLAAMIGVLKAGGVYVPVDPQAPAQRAGYIVENCAMKGLVTTADRLAALATDHLRSVEFCLMIGAPGEAGSGPERIPWDQVAALPRSPVPSLSPTTLDLAYILYTSGSTGRPKGVMLSHQNALTFVNWGAETLNLHPEDHFSNHAPLHFDLSVFDVYNALKAGATVYMVPEDVLMFPASLAAFIEAQAISVWYSVPSALVYLILHGNLKGRNLSSLRVVLFAGEVFPMKYLRQLAEIVPQADLYNLYGPTETNVCTYYRVERERLGELERLPIGQACSNTETFAVNEGDELIKPGETGELFVRGPSVTSGYWGDAEKTKQLVVANRFQPHFDEKMYRTGDLVKLLDDGNYDFIGRRDSQIKSRGYRIELGEIETAMLSHPHVREAAALAVPDGEIGNRIKAVVALHQAESLSVLELQQYCASRIPKYMIPELVEFYPVLPKTSTGKIDRVQLTQGARS